MKVVDKKMAQRAPLDHPIGYCYLKSPGSCITALLYACNRHTTSSGESRLSNSNLIVYLPTKEKEKKILVSYFRHATYITKHDKSFEKFNLNVIYFLGTR